MNVSSELLIREGLITILRNLRVIIFKFFFQFILQVVTYV